MRRLITFTNLFPSSLRPMHGLFVVERMRRVVQALPDDGTDWDWRVVAPRPKVPWGLRRFAEHDLSAMPDREVVDGVPVCHPAYFHLPGTGVRRQADRMARAALPVVEGLRDEVPDAVFDAHYLWPDGVAAAEIAQRLGLPYTLTARGSDLNVLAEDPVIAERIGAAVQDAAALFTVSEALRVRLLALSGLSADRVVCARNGVDPEVFHPGDVAAARATFGLPADALILLGVGRLVEGKGFHLAAKALRRLDESVHLALVGAGPEQARIEQLAPDGRVHFLGAQPPERVATAYRAADLFVLPSDREGWPNVVTEALASGLRVVATTVGGIPEILGSPQVGALVRPGDADALGREIARMLALPRDPDGVARFARRYSWDAPVALHVDALRRAVSGGKAR